MRTIEQYEAYARAAWLLHNKATMVYISSIHGKEPTLDVLVAYDLLVGAERYCDAEAHKLLSNPFVRKAAVRIDRQLAGM
jgi:hypothetical protein